MTTFETPAKDHYGDKADYEDDMKDAAMTVPMVDPKTTGQIMEILALADDGAIEATRDQMAAWGAQLAGKQDANRFVSADIKSQIAAFSAMKKQLTQAIKTLRNQDKRQKQYLAFHMLAHNLKIIPGIIWKTQITSSAKVKMRRDCQPLDAIQLERFVITTHKWNLDAVKRALKLKDVDAVAIADLVTDNSVKFAPYKGAFLDVESKPKRRSEKTAKLLGAAAKEQGADSPGAAEAHDSGSDAKDSSD